MDDSEPVELDVAPESRRCLYCEGRYRAGHHDPDDIATR